MIKRYFQVDAPGADAMHAEPIAALAALNRQDHRIEHVAGLVSWLRAGLDY